MKLTDFLRIRKPQKGIRTQHEASLLADKESYPVTGRGVTQEAAIRALASALAAATNGDFTPSIYIWYGNVALLWREGAEWWYTIRDLHVQGKVRSNYVGCGAKREEAEHSMLIHLCQYAIDQATNESGAQAAVAILPDVYDRDEQVARWLRERKVKQLQDQFRLPYTDASMVVDGLLTLEQALARV